ncbi:MAG: hypothetical protein QOE71_4071 [Pseudonocardiales bacterium]|nr:hypothetical protein [Pseudonocardiales bacterium]MDQ1753015.1 hypothetical protein [Pseudonocardiales bacterium]
MPRTSLHGSALSSHADQTTKVGQRSSKGRGELGSRRLLPSILLGLNALSGLYWMAHQAIHACGFNHHR